MADLPPLNHQDAILQYISSNFVSVKESDKTFYKGHLEFVVTNLIKNMKDVDIFFCTMFQRDEVAGSFWDGLKIGKPVEFDKNFVLRLPRCFMNSIQFLPALPSFVLVNVKRGFADLQRSDKWEQYKKIESWLDRDGNIISDKVRFWMESVIVRAVDSFPSYSNAGWSYKLSTRKAGPAMTVEVEINPGSRQFNIDIVPAFEFQPAAWPKHIRPYPKNIPDAVWHVVPKPIKPNESESGANRSNYGPDIQWRLSFHNQESYRIHDKFHLKAVLKLIKKMRDVKLDQDMLCSYAIKTVFLWEMDDHDDSFWQRGLSVTFLHMLNVLVKFLRSGNLPFYWQKEHNLLGKLKEVQRDQLFRTVQRIQNQIHHGLRNEDWLVIAREILTDEEFHQLEGSFDI
ncbi:uncharacterized protein LOC117653275 isoform X2 [Thrips palmi]|uniref:Uncharacterized protein LOC117653275 isoform X2 n=1 Tax=Thrips palmi TaxID=161013 RepID=A0A6P9A9L6_THRPL|nr:uncharacterized protein LOC117653275 isoform X2 [Thrips palmi]